jgi:hypothetical protein
MPKKKRPSEKPEEQFERFVETARQVEVDETGITAEKAFKSLLRDRPASKDHKKTSR